MSQHYSNPKREKEPHALPDVETFLIGRNREACPTCNGTRGEDPDDTDHNNDHRGWYYWFCFPGCMPDSEANGPFETEAEALADARKGLDDED